MCGVPATTMQETSASEQSTFYGPNGMGGKNKNVTNIARYDHLGLSCGTDLLGLPK